MTIKRFYQVKKLLKSTSNVGFKILRMIDKLLKIFAIALEIIQAFLFE